MATAEKRTTARSRDGAPDLSQYHAKRDFTKTAEPKGGKRVAAGNRFIIQKHAATRLHYDLRLEQDGVLKSWAVTRGPSLDPGDKRLAVHVEDHPVEYGDFEGTIPKGNYGGGTVMLWDRGTWTPVGDPGEGLEKGKLTFHLDGERLKGAWTLVRMHGGRTRADRGRDNWLLIKNDDETAEPGRDILAEHMTSVTTGRSMEAIAAGDTEWVDGKARTKPGGKPGSEGQATKGRRRKRGLPAFVEPKLATLVDDVPEGPDWLFEVKFDGYRAIVAADAEEVRIYTRKGLDWTTRFPTVARAVAALGLEGALLDGEIVVVDAEGKTDFGALQAAMNREDADVVMFVFDLLVDRGKSLAERPLRERKDALRERLGGGRSGPVFFSDHVEGHGREMLETLCGRKFEGLIAKLATAPYRSGRNADWLKVKCALRQEFVIAGTSPSDRHRPFASLLLGLQGDDGLVYAGRVGSGFSQGRLEELDKRFAALERKTSPFVGKLPKAVTKGARWIEPKLVAEVEFAGFTKDRQVRQGRFVGLREDKAPEEIVAERPKPVEEEVRVAEAGASRAPKASTKASPKARKGRDGATWDPGKLPQVRLTHPEKLLYPDEKISKGEVASYLAMVAPHMLPFIERRLVSLVRCPDGTRKACFFQRHRSQGMPESFVGFAVKEKDGDTEDYLYLDGIDGLLSCAQIGALEVHIWGSTIDDIERPDRLVFDLDPGEDVAFSAVKDAALKMREALEAIGLASFPMLTGGKGIHVVAPLQPERDWPVVKATARALAEFFAEKEPGRFVATMTKAKRGGKIFIDHFRNERGSTAVAPFSTRARKGAPVAWPLRWTDLPRIAQPGLVTIVNAGEHDPTGWEDYSSVRQGIGEAVLSALGVRER
jgi:bifunctional non-homologous end joining protein LigD